MAYIQSTGFGGHTMTTIIGAKITRPKKPCKVCALMIPEAATYCTKCESYQSWARHLQFGQTTLALVVAFAAIVTPAIPSIVNAFQTKDSRLQSTAMEFEAGALKLTVSNFGERPGTLDGVTVSMFSDVKLFGVPTLRFMQPSEDGSTVEPGEVHRFTLSLEELLPHAKEEVERQLLNGYAQSVAEGVAGGTGAKLLQSYSCTVSVKMVQFSGDAGPVKTEWQCFDVWAKVFPESRARFDEVARQVLTQSPLPRLPAPSVRPQPSPTGQ